jgi:uncharacterized membrane protein
MENHIRRLEAFCDGVFAIALTLLIIEIKIPELKNVNSKEELWSAFANAWPSWIAFLVSFITILISWVVHSHGLSLIKKTSTKFTYANGFLLLSIIVLPYFTQAVAEYINTSLAQPAITLYCGISLLQNLAWNAIQFTTFYPESLYKSSVNTKKIKKIFTLTRFAFGFYSITVLISFWFPIVAFTMVALCYVAWLVISMTLKEERMII